MEQSSSINCIVRLKLCKRDFGAINNDNTVKSILIYVGTLVVVCLHSLPWNQTTPFGYVGEACFVIATAEAFLFGNGSTFLLFISLCIHHHAFYSMYKHLISKYNHNGNNAAEIFLRDLTRFNISIKE